jgi:hypothetical protein
VVVVVMVVEVVLVPNDHLSLDSWPGDQRVLVYAMKVTRVEMIALVLLSKCKRSEEEVDLESNDDFGVILSRFAY